MDPINGLYGFIYDENGKELQGTQEFSSVVEFTKTPFKQAGQFMDKHRVTSGSGSGNIRRLKVGSRLQKKILENPTAKYSYIGKLDDPTVDGKEAVLYSGVSFDSAPLVGYTLGELVETDLPFTFDKAEFIESID